VLVVGLVGLGIAWYQWYNSDIAALKAMRARVVTAEEAPELHGMIDRLCALANMPKPRVAIAYTDMPNAFATGRSANHSAVCVTTGIMAAMLTRGAQYGAIFGGGNRGRGNNNNAGGLPIWLVVLVVSLVVYAVSFFLTRMLSRYRELCADRAGAFLTGKPSALASALTKITGEIAAIPNRDLRASQPMNAFFIAPAISGATLKTLTSTHPSLEQRLEQLAKISAELGRPMDGGFPDPGLGFRGPTGS
jgi:heat shock protein HtpX